jgi:hypothetical protein
MFGTHRRVKAELHFPDLMPVGGVRLAAVVTALAVALAGCSTTSKTPTTSKATSTPTMPTTSQAPSTPTPTAPRVPEDRLSSILLTVDEGNAIMGATNMEDLGGLATLDTNAFAVSNPDCLGAAHIVQPPVYSHSMAALSRGPSGISWGDPPKISLIMNRHNARDWTCQRALSAVWNVVIDAKACAFKIANQGVQVADKIAAKATQ